jgi:redox-sensitive bicupin YhaK (pirin superfamily)
MSIRPVRHQSTAVPHLEGAGVHLQRAFGFDDPSMTDPFLLFDDFRGDRPEDYLAGFPWHPHRGIETITYVLAGEVAHGDSLGNSGNLAAGDVQWMTAGSGIMHQEMPTGNTKGQMHGFQLWANLPSSLKMTTPRYQDVKSADIPVVVDDDGTAVRVIVGSFWGKSGPVDGIAADPQYLDISVPPGVKKTFKVDTYKFAPSPMSSRGPAPLRCLQAVRGAAREGSGGRGGQHPRHVRRPHRGALRHRRRDHRASGPRRCAFPAGFRQPDPRACRLARADRHEHSPGAHPGGDRTAERHLHQAGTLEPLDLSSVTMPGSVPALFLTAVPVQRGRPGGRIPASRFGRILLHRRMFDIKQGVVWGSEGSFGLPRFAFIPRSPPSG